MLYTWGCKVTNRTCKDEVIPVYDVESINKLLQQPRTGYVLEDLLKLAYCLITRQLYKFRLSKEPDAISLAYEALYNAILTYTDGKGSSFKTYATVCIYNALGGHVRKLKTLSVANTYLYESVTGKDISMIQDTISIDDGILRQCNTAELASVFNSCYTQLTVPLQKSVVNLWASSGFSMTQTEISLSVGCAQTYVTKILKKFRQDMKNKLEEFM